jgi:DNA-binding MarR family transcriptional regulator
VYQCAITTIIAGDVQVFSHCWDTPRLSPKNRYKTKKYVAFDSDFFSVIIQSLNFEMEIPEEKARELTLLEQIERDPDVTQASLATQLGVAVGTVNWHIKRLIEKGAVKVKRAERKKLRYIITPEGIALRARLTVDYIERSFDLYRKTRQRVKTHINEVKRAGYDSVRLIGEGDVADICRLSCLEQEIKIVQDESVPALEVKGFKVLLRMEDSE